MTLTFLQRAEEFAKVAYKDCFRKSGENMFVHASNVAKILFDAGLDEYTVAAGFFHDLIEDTDITFEVLVSHFGEKVTFIVVGHTEEKERVISKKEATGVPIGDIIEEISPDKVRIKVSWEERKQTTINELADPKTAFEVRALIIADRLDNLRDIVKEYKKIGEDIWKRFKRGKEQQEWYFRQCLKYMAVGLTPDQIPSFFFDYEKELNDFFK